MKLQDSLPRGVRVGKRFYKLDLDFRAVLRLIDTMAREDLLPDARDYLALKCVMKHPRRVRETLEAVKALLFPVTRKSADKKKITDFAQDADLIRAAFMQVYRIDLYTEKIHWFKFSALLAGLPEGNRYSDVLGIRARPMPAPTKYNAEERRWLAKAKAELALKLTDAEREQSYKQGLHDMATSLINLASQGR